MSDHPTDARTDRPFEAVASDELRRRRGDLAYLAQMCALESIDLDDAQQAELRALDDELRRRAH